MGLGAIGPLGGFVHYHVAEEPKVKHVNAIIPHQTVVGQTVLAPLLIPNPVILPAVLSMEVGGFGLLGLYKQPVWQELKSGKNLGTAMTPLPYAGDQYALVAKGAAVH